MGIHDYLALLRRRAAAVLLGLVLVPAVAVLLSHSQTRLYAATSQVLLNEQNVAAAVGSAANSNNQPADRLAQTQADLARVPAVAALALRLAHSTGSDPQELLAASSVEIASNSNLLVFTVTEPDGGSAVGLANAYANAYTLYRRRLDTNALKEAARNIQARLAGLPQTSSAYGRLVGNLQQLQTLEALQTSNATLVKRADSTAVVQPRTARNAALGVAAGLILGILLALLWEALDTRLRTPEDIAHALDLPLLGQIPSLGRRDRKVKQIALLAAPLGPQAEAYRMARANLEFAFLARPVRTILVTSALPAEGKTATAANLGLALASVGRSVCVVELDVRRPSLGAALGLDPRRGVSDVALGHAAIGDVLQILTAQQPGVNTGESSVGISVLAAGRIPPNPGEFVGLPVIQEMLEALTDMFDCVLIDAPPLLIAGDALHLSGYVDALVVVSRLGTIRRRSTAALRATLAPSLHKVVGVVVTNVPEKLRYGYYGYGMPGGSSEPFPPPTLSTKRSPVRSDPPTLET